MIAYVIFENNSRKNKEFLRKSEKLGGIAMEREIWTLLQAWGFL